MISIGQMIKIIPCNLVHPGEKLNFNWVIASGLMSDVLTTDKDDILLISNLTTPQVIRTADMVSANAVLITNGKQIMPDTIKLAKELNITLLKTELSIFEACYHIGKLIYGDQ